ncbi:MAG: HAMP domain-containing sensor histidine kinase [Ignavibacteriae bacterium]|nr:HAMP domain-containing sensor histidine kinase [Ignavibacteriota bacterium]
MLGLIPSYTYDFEQLWSLLINRNKWIIKLRYFVSIGLASFTIISSQLLKLEFSREQFNALIIISALILIYNILLNFLINTSFVKNDPERFNPMHISLLQILADQVSLAAVIYYTGGIESPFYIFFIFHMIIGSLILSGFVVYSIAGITVICFYIASLLEYFTVIPHHKFGVLLSYPIYNELDYVLLFATSFGITMVVCVFFANSIAHSHYVSGQKLRVAYEKLKDAEAVKQKYTIGIVHEIKSPLSSVQSYHDIILEGYTGSINPQVKEKLVRARARTDEAIQIINDILSISKLKLQTGIKKEEVDLIQLLHKIISKKKVQADYLRIGINFYDLSTKKDVIKADCALLELAFSNLIGNGIKYTNPGGIVEIVVEDGKSDKEIEVEICDNGIGIPEKDKEKIFKEFFRASNVKYKSYEGTGLGLSVVKQIVEQHGGKITFQSPSRLANEDGAGTCFKLTLKKE